MTDNRKEARAKMINQVMLELGHKIVDVELDQEHLEHALDTALDRYRQRSSNAVEEAYSFIDLQPEQTEYYMPSEMIEVRQIFRRSIGGQATGGGSQIEPFSLAFTNLYLLQAGRQGGLATYDFFSQYQETVGRMFGQHMNFIYNSQNKKLTIMRKIVSPEQVLLWHYNYRPDQVLLDDTYARPWLRDYSTAMSKVMLAQGRGKFSQIAGPQGGTSLNADSLRSEAEATFEKLENDLKNYAEGSQPPYFIIG